MTTPTLPYDYPLTPLEYLREAIGYNPYLFWGMRNAKVLSITNSECNDVIYEYAWQHADQIGRAAMRDAILEAEIRIREEAMFSVAPHFGEETLDYAQINQLAQNARYNVTQYGAGDPLSRWTGVQLQEGYIQGLGYEDLTLLGNETVTISDTDGDGLLDSFVLTVATAETDPKNLAVYFIAADRLDSEPVSERWRVQPISISISGGTATIRGRSWLLVKPILYQGAASLSVLDPDDTTIYVDDLAVYTRKVNSEGTDVSNCQAKMIWETTPLPAYWWYCPPSPVDYSTDPATVGYAVGRAGIRNAKLGIVTPAQATYNATTGNWSENYPIWNYRPDRVTIRYYAGYPLEAGGQINKTIRSVVTDLAIASMPERICACDVANRVLHYLQWDLARIANGVEQYATTRGHLNNVFGTRRGQVQAWRNLKALAIVRGVSY